MTAPRKWVWQQCVSDATRMCRLCLSGLTVLPSDRMHCLTILLLSIAGTCAQNMVDPSQYLEEFPAAFAPLKPSFDLTSLSSLYSSVDFIGISAYPSLSPNFTTKDIESATQQFDTEISYFGIDLKNLIFNQVLCAVTPFACMHACPCWDKWVL